MIARRGFLGMFVAAAVAPLLPQTAIKTVAPELLRLWGDGIHDDTAALQQRIDLGGTIYLVPGTYLISTTLNITSSCGIICK